MPPPNPFLKRETIAAQVVAEIIVNMKLDKQVKRTQYRPDYDDYFVVLSDGSRCALRELSIKGYHEAKDGDLRREIEGRIKAAKAPEEWEDDIPNQKKPVDDIVIDIDRE